MRQHIATVSTSLWVLIEAEANSIRSALIAVQAGVDRRDMAVVTSFRNFTRNFGDTIGLAVAATILSVYHNLAQSS